MPTASALAPVAGAGSDLVDAALQDAAHAGIPSPAIQSGATPLHGSTSSRVDVAGDWDVSVMDVNPATVDTTPDTTNASVALEIPLGDVADAESTVVDAVEGTRNLEDVTPPARTITFRFSFLPHATVFTLEDVDTREFKATGDGGRPVPSDEETVATPDRDPVDDADSSDGREAQALKAVSAGKPAQTSAVSSGGATSTGIATWERLPVTVVEAGSDVATLALLLAVPVFAGWSLHQRIRGRSHLEQETRRRLYDTVCGKPGISVAEAARLANVSYSTATYHLDRLARAKLLLAEGSRPRIRYYQNGGSLNEDERRAHEVLESEGAMNILQVIRERPGTYRAAIADALNVTPTTVNWHLRPLMHLGLVTEERQGRSATLWVNEARLREVVGPLAEKLNAGAGGETARRILSVTSPAGAGG